MFTAFFSRTSPAAAALGILAALALTACGSSSPTSPDQSNIPFTQSDLRVGTGDAAAAGFQLTVNYTGWIYSDTAPENKGSQFDSSTGRGPLTFTLGNREVIPGWDQGLVGMKVGGIRRLVVPPGLAYGATGNPPIPPNAALVFEVELLDLQ